MPIILSVGTKPPENILSQSEAVQFAKEMFSSSFSNIERLLTVFQNGDIKKRHFVESLEWYKEAHSFSEKNNVYIKHAVQLSIEAIHRCLSRKDLLKRSVDYAEIDAIFFISSTGMSTPTIDVKILNQLPFKETTKRVPIWGLGCAGGAVGLSRAFEYCQAYPDAKVLVLSVELCSLTFQHDDLSKSNLIGTSLFADGVACALVVGDQSSYADFSHLQSFMKIFATQSNLMPHSEDVMGWDIREKGFYVIFSRDIPSIIEKWLRPNVEQFLQKHSLQLKHIDHFVAHPGGKKVLRAYERSLQLQPKQLLLSREVLKLFGNMSSATVLYVIEKYLTENIGQKGEYGLIAAMGPGFCSEQLLVRWGHK
ncbi:3-oxoacyl-[acyl-carrier-protein] synthase III C-terminal domain-containing protein [Bacillus sp. FJAT-47783]|uniref:type III polyketide synthase n=1 Tax=Bacillus sp. FJAT-47783 TaxID=2922712 RepID=UPI001FABEDF4|nr:3-oxoacyl-[acyl-carrier-protein] synthase III C-terminal domain-containing protein [Bacillus sp. FJAT-47783]